MMRTSASYDTARAISIICRWAIVRSLTRVAGIDIDVQGGQKARPFVESEARSSTNPKRVSGSRPRKMFSATVIDGMRCSS